MFTSIRRVAQQNITPFDNNTKDLSNVHANLITFLFPTDDNNCLENQILLDTNLLKWTNEASMNYDHFGNVMQHGVNNKNLIVSFHTRQESHANT